MNAEQLLAHYERVSEAPDAIERLKQLVLDLAVRGNLVPQDSNEESSPQFVARLAAERARLVKEKVIRASSAAPPIRDEELPIQIPPNWSWLRLCQVGRISGGMTPSMNRPDYWGGEVIWLSPKDIKSDKVSNSELKITAKGLSETRLEAYRPGCLFIVARSGILKRTLPVAINTVPAAANQDMKVLVPFIEGQERYLQIMFRGLMHFILSSLVKTGTTVQSLKYDEFEAQPFPIPPLAEQHRIVAKVDELMALCDRLEAARAQREATRDRLTASTLTRLNTPEPPASPDGDASKESSFQSDARFALKILPALTTRPDQIKQLRQTILNLAVQGKLVSRVSREGPAGPLLARLKAAKQFAHEAEELRARIPPRSPTRSDLNFDFPTAWAVAAFDDLFVIVSGVTKGQKIPASESIEAPYLRVANVQRGYLDLDVIKTISVRASDIQRYALRVGDILMTEGGDWDKLGRAAVWRDEIPGCIHQNHVFRVRPPSSEIVSEWVTTYVNSPLGRAFFEDASKQTTNLASINMTQLRSCPIPLPPTAEQHRIVAKVDELMSLCDQLEASLTCGENTRSRLLNALLHEALHASHENVIDFEAARQRLLEKRQAVACRVVERLSRTKGFGRVRAVKPLYFAETHCGVALGGRWGRGDFGPYDHWILSFELQAMRAGWLTRTERQTPDGNTRIEYTPGTHLSSKAQAAAQALGEGAAEFERVLDLLAGLDTPESEMVATLYAAWNDLLIEKKPVSDDLVISEFREHWGSARKADFDSPRLRKWLDWMRKNQLTPIGREPSTRHQAELI